MRLYLFFALLLPAALHAQQTAPPTDTLPRPRWVLKLAPLAMVDFDPTIQGAAEYRFGPSVSVQQELGFLRIANWISIDEDMPRSVFRSRTEVRLYVSRHRAAPQGAYLAVEGFGKYISQPRNGEVNQGSYFETTRYRLTKRVLGGHFKFGGQRAIGGSDRWLLDGFLGVGLRTVRMKAAGPQGEVDPLDFNPLDLVEIGNGRTRYSIPSFTMGLKVGYMLPGGKAARPAR